VKDAKQLLLEFRLKIATEDLPPVSEKGKRKATRLSASRGSRDDTGVKKGEPYLENDKAERKASGAYYTPDHIVQYIVEHAVGPVLKRKLDELRPAFRDAEKTYQREWSNAKANSALLAGVIPQHVNAKGMPLPRTDEDLRAFALRQTLARHKDLVEKLFHLKVLDPAMGSGHFLVETVDFVTDTILDFLNSFPANPVTAAMDITRKSILDSLRDQGIETDAVWERQLTDVHLIKRHVLKRCIYGVDLNPLATELAKVSLWLDAFTIGAPLSFLDHHIRVGNSLLGATVQQAQDALHENQATLFGSRFAGLKLAAVGMAAVAALPDATADQVKLSQREYHKASDALAPFKRILDAYVMQWFLPDELLPKAMKGKREEHPAVAFLKSRAGEEFFSAGDDRLRAALDGLSDDDRKLADALLSIAQARRFFHWELEFPEAFYEARAGAKTSVERMENPGFDVVVGNPPYLRQESFKADKDFLKTAFAETFDSGNDLYVYFMQREIDFLRSGGLMSMIVANKWLRAGYGRRLRSYLTRHTVPQGLVDFGHTPIFPDADTFPCVPTFARRATPLAEGEQPAADETFAACPFPRDDYRPNMPIAPYVVTHRKTIPTRLLRADGWTLEDPRVQVLMQKIRKAGSPLATTYGTRIFSGVKTGFNEAFYINAETRSVIVRKHGPSAEVIQPLLRGRDIDRWRPKQIGTWLIAIPSSQNARWPWSGESREAEQIFSRKQPAIYQHLFQYKQQLKSRQDQGEFWWELRSCDYYEEFKKQKIVVQCIGYHSRWARDDCESFINNKAYCIPSDSLALLAILNSPAIWWLMWRTFPHMKDEAFSIDGQCIELLPIPDLPAQLDGAIGEIAAHIVQNTDELFSWEQSYLDGLATAANVPPDRRVLSWLTVAPEVFSQRLGKLAEPGGRPRVHSLAALASIQQRGRARQVELLTRQLDLEKRLATLVEDAYGLTPEERALMRATRPVRDPLDVLEAKIAGQPVAAEADVEGEEE
jgi:hypothetical protein